MGLQRTDLDPIHVGRPTVVALAEKISQPEKPLEALRRRLSDAIGKPRQADQALADRPYPGLLLQDDLPPRGPHLREIQRQRLENQEEPIPSGHRDQVLESMTAYQIIAMMEDVVTRGTAAGKI